MRRNGHSFQVPVPRDGKAAGRNPQRSDPSPAPGAGTAFAGPPGAAIMGTGGDGT